jgi:hypothetical protein
MRLAEQTIKPFFSLLILVLAQSAMAGSPDCSGINSWATSMAFTHLKNAGLISSETTDFSKTKTVRLTSEKIGKDLYRQVHQVSFTEKSGNTIEVITVSDASHEECSMSGVDVFVVSKHLGNQDQPGKAQ